ncbi:MAG: sensor histidine kinase, partial [Desulfomonilaceae bacterium]
LSHELKTPLSILKATIKSLWELCESNSKAYKLIERAERNLDRLLSIQDSVEQIFSPRKPHPQKLQVENFTNEIVAKILHIAHHREIKLEIDCEKNGSIFFDPDIMEEILTILIKNAFENTPDKGLIKIVLSESNSGNFALTVHDYGVGIPFKDLEFIFEGFYHTQDTSEYSTKKPFDFNAGGKGLELFQLKRLSEIYKFKIDLQSRRCVYIPEPTDHCPGQINLCPYINKLEDCLCSGYSIFTVNFTNISL